MTDSPVVTHSASCPPHDFGDPAFGVKRVVHYKVGKRWLICCHCGFTVQTL